MIDKQYLNSNGGFAKSAMNLDYRLDSTEKNAKE